MTQYYDQSQEDKAKIESIVKLVEVLDKESDRGCCLLSVAFLDNELQLLLENKLIGSTKNKKELFALHGALGTFSSRISLGYSIGLIDSQIKDDINIIRKIRNKFGHNYEYIDFNSSDISDQILNLNYNFYEKDEVSIRKMFISSVTIILTEIHEVLALESKFIERKNKEYVKNPDLKALIIKINDIIYNKK